LSVLVEASFAFRHYFYSIMNITSLIDITPFTWEAVFTCLACGTIIGGERQFRGKPVGIRTASLIVLGTYVFLACSIMVSEHAKMSDPSRIIGQVMAGIGFIGAGVMLSKGRNVYGVTSAATIWVLASIGVCIAVGQIRSAVTISVVVLIILFGLDVFEDYTHKVGKTMHTRLRGWRERRGGTQTSRLEDD